MFEVKWTKSKRLSNLIKQVGKLDNQDVKYGYFEEQGSHPETPDITYAELMAIHELRPKSDPLRRPVFEISINRNKDEFTKHNLLLIKDYLGKSAVIKKPSPKAILESIGEEGIRFTKPTFGDVSLLRPNSPSTSSRKGRNSPMVDFGYLKEALAYKTSLRKGIKTFN